MVTKRRIPTRNRIAELLEDHHTETLQKADHLREIIIRLRYEGKLSLGKNLTRAKETLRFFGQEMSEHMAEEEKTLFPFLETHVPKLEPLILLLRSEHQDFRRNVACFKLLLSELERAKDDLERGRTIEKLKEIGMYLIYLLQSHLQEESEILYRAAEQGLRADEKRELIRQLSPTSVQRR